MPTFKLGDLVRKTKGSSWHGRVVGTYSTDLTPEGYCVESATERGSVQIYPVAALEKWDGIDERPINLEPVIEWLERGCDPLLAAQELRIYQEAIQKG